MFPTSLVGRLFPGRSGPGAPRGVEIEQPDECGQQHQKGRQRIALSGSAAVRIIRAGGLKSVQRLMEEKAQRSHDEGGRTCPKREQCPRRRALRPVLNGLAQGVPLVDRGQKGQKNAANEYQQVIDCAVGGVQLCLKGLFLIFHAITPLFCSILCEKQKNATNGMIFPALTVPLACDTLSRTGTETGDFASKREVLTAMSFALRTYMPPDFSALDLGQAPDAVFEPAPLDGVAPEHYHAMSIFPEYFKVDGRWLLAEESRMDCVAVYEDGRIVVREFRCLKQGDRVAVGRTEDGRQGIYVHPDGFGEQRDAQEIFAFRQGRSRETAFSQDYNELYEILRHDRDHGKIVWVLGPAFSFDKDARDAFSQLIRDGYVHALLAGNALATHDLEGAYLNTALGQNIYTKRNQPNGHYNHLDTINRVRFHGSIGAFIEKEHIDNGIIYHCEKYGVPYVLAGSIRDDGPLPPVYGNAYEAQDAMRDQIRGATTVICMATMLHTIATGNMTPSYRVMPDGTVRQIYFYCVDISEFAVNKLSDRGSLSARGIITNVQDFICNTAKALDESKTPAFTV